MSKQTHTQVRVEKIEMAIKRCQDKKLKNKEKVISHLYLLMFTLEAQERKFLKTLS